MAVACEGRGKMSDRGTILQQGVDGLEEGVATAVIGKRAHPAQGQPRIIGGFGAAPEVSTGCGETLSGASSVDGREGGAGAAVAQKISHQPCQR